MFGELIERVQVLATKIIYHVEVRGRKRARYQVAGDIFSTILAKTLPNDLHHEDYRKGMRETALQFAAEIEARVYQDDDSEIDLEA